MRRFSTLALAAIAATACGADELPEASEAMASVSTISASVDQELPTVLVYKTPTCGCCNGWVEHLRAAGFNVDARDVNDIVGVKLDAGVPGQMSSCHTAMVDGYVVEGHVPAEQIKRLLAERPAIAGIAVPGMPVGSPGMEGPNAQPYRVLSFGHDGTSGVFAEVDPR